MKRNNFILKHLLTVFLLLGAFAFKSSSQTVLFDYHFNASPLPAGVTTNAPATQLETGKNADGVCSRGSLTVGAGQYMEVQASSIGAFRVNMKSSGGSGRTVNVKYKKEGATDFTTAATFTVQVAASFNFTESYPQIASSGPVTVRIESTSGNLQIHDLYVEGSAVQSSAAEILEFKLPSQVGSEVINSAAGTILINVPQGTNLTAVVPQRVVISPQATIDPAVNTPQDFSGQKEVTYTVTAQNGTTAKAWKVSVSEVASSAKEITAFMLSNTQVGGAIINGNAGTITVSMPQAEDLSNLTPVTFTVSPFATVNPAGNSAQNFNQPVVYTVTAQDGSTKQWTITVNKVDPNAVFYDYQAETAEFTGKTDNVHQGYTGSGFIDFLAAGENYIIFTTCQTQAGPQTAKFRYSFAKDEVRTGSLYVNDVFVKTLAFPRTATFTEWVEETSVVSLTAGINKIKITWETTDGPNLDKMSLSGSQCASYTLNITSSHAAGIVTASPERADKKYYEGETVTLLAKNTPELVFANWSGDLTGSTNPAQVVMNSNKTITANYTVVNTYKLNVTTSGIGEVVLSPAGGTYAEGTVVTLQAKSVLGSTFQGWSGDASGINPTTTVTMTSIKNVTATFTSSIALDFERVIGFASISGDNFTGPTTGGKGVDTVFINGPSEFPKLCQVLQDRIRYKTYHNRPLTIVLEEGVYTGAGGQLSVWGNDMLTVQEQSNLTIIGRKNVTLKFGINLKRASNIIIRNLSFQEYGDDGINIGETETHHVWVDHCTVGHPTTLPANPESPDGGIDIKGGASYVTVSWTKYRNSWKTGLVGHSDSNGGEDNGRLKVTYFANYFVNTNSRNPRVRFGQVHVLNNLEERVMLYGIAASNNSQVYAENNFFLNTRWPMYADRTTADFKAVYGNNTDNTFTSKTGNYPATGLKQVGNEYDDSGLPVITAQINPAMLNPGGRSIKFDSLNPQAVFNPRSYYDYEAYSASTVRSIVPMYAGADMVDFWAQQATLPLHTLSFDAALSSEKKAKVTWSTANEANADAFVVERSKDGRTYEAVGKIAANNASGVNTYTFSDSDPVTGTVYYRLKQLDKDGRFTYSKVVTLTNKMALTLTVFPNPASQNITISHAKAGAGSFIKIVSSVGQTIKQKAVAIGSIQTAGLDISTLAPGYYLVVFEDNGRTSSTKLIKK